MKKRFLSVLLTLSFFTALIPLLSFSSSAAYFSIQQAYGTDYSVFAPGVFDLVVATDAEGPTYEWFCRVDRGDSASSYMSLEDNEYYSGVHTSHLKLITHDGLAYVDGQTGWENIYFSCRVTDKNGTSRFGPDMNMVIFTHQALLDRLERDGVKFNRFGIDTAVASREIDGVTYCDVPADRVITAGASFSLPSDDWKTRFYDSEAELRREYVFTEGGNVTTKYEGSSYTPHTVGMGAVQVRANLVLYMRGIRMETLDTRSLVVNVLTPDGIGGATTKSSAAVLEERYSQARVLATLPAGTYVRLISPEGGYYKAVAGGVVGFIPATALNIMDNIGTVAFTVPEPEAYSTAASTVTLDAGADYVAEARFNQEMWHDDTANKFLSPGDTFLPNHEYALQVWLTAKNGKRFHVENNKPVVSAFVNGLPANVYKAYEQDPEEVIEVSIKFDHVHNLSKVNRVYPTCTTAGKEYHYRCSCGWAFEDAEAKTKIIDENWGIIPARGHWESTWVSNGKEHYKFCQRRECGAEIAGTRGAHTGGKATCMSGAVCTVCGLEYGAKGAHNWSANWSYSDASGHAHNCLNLCGSHSAIQAHRPGKAATATEPQVCLDCGYIIMPATNHTHDIKKVSAKAATCTAAGNKEYYKCSLCGMLFSDAAGKSGTSESAVRISALGHKTSKEWTIDEASHWHLCSRCGEVIAATKAPHDFKGEKEECTVCGYVKGAETVATKVDTSVTEAETEDTKGAKDSATPESATDSETKVDAGIGKPALSSGEPEESGDRDGDGEKDGVNVILIVVILLVVAAIAAGVIIFIMKKKKEEENKEDKE